VASAAKAAAGAVAALVFLIVACVAAIAGLLGAAPPAAPTRYATADIPPRMLVLYRKAASACPGLPWTVLAAIGKVETDHGRARRQTSTVGAVGPMQFLPATFAAYAHPVPPGGARPPTPWDPVDAVYAAARLLCASGARHGRHLAHAIHAYNHSATYVRRVLALAARYAHTQPPPPPARAAIALAYARRQLGRPYLWGGTGDGGFDCSGLTQAAYRAAGTHLPRTAQQQYDAGPRLPPGTELRPGDLLFYGTSPRHITHTGLYTAPRTMIDAPHPHAVVRHDPIHLPGLTLQGATRPATPGQTR
jgi:cell wall-associated NlpC family hydrolase